MAVNSWSHSKLMDFEKCKKYFWLKHDQKIPEPERPLPPGKTEHANDRGTRVHQSCEDFVTGKTHELCPEADQHFGFHLDLLRTMYKDGLVSLEGEWGHNRDWEPWAWSGDWLEIEEPAELGLPSKKVKTLPARAAPETIYLVGKKAFIWEPPWLRLKLDAMVMHDETTATVIDYKGLPLGTLIPTPAGWTTMGEIRVGDSLFDAAGNVCTVRRKSQIKHLDNYRISFDDTSTAECDAEHLWTLHDGTVTAVTDLKSGDLINTAAPLQLPEASLPIDPYVLGIWLADGKHSTGEICKPDAEIWDEIQRRGYTVGDDYNRNRNHEHRCRTHTVIGLRTALGELDLLGDKHIPQVYMRASYQQRLDLLRGLFDGDGSANHRRKRAVLNTTREDFARQVQELLLSLGQRPLVSPYKATGFGKTVDAWAVSFRPNGINPFLLPRKANKVLKTWGPGEAWRRKIVKVEQIASQPTQCILVDSPDHTFLCTEKFIPTHNTGRKFGNEIKHAEQLQLYQLATFMRYPQLQTVHAELWYLDQNETTSQKFSRAMGLRYRDKFTKRGDALTSCTDFPAAANIHACRWCQYGPWNGGQCAEGVRTPSKPGKKGA